MKRYTTFEDIFNKLISEYRGEKVEVTTKQDGVVISNFTTTIGQIEINPLSKRQSRKWSSSGKKVGLIVIKDKKKKDKINIPFLLGFDTMQGIFFNKGATIKSLNMEFVIKRAGRRKRLA